MKKEGVSCMKIYNEGEEPEEPPQKKKGVKFFMSLQTSIQT